MDPLRDDFSPVAFFRDNPHAFLNAILNLPPVTGTDLVYFSIPSNDWLWKQKFLAALEGNETFRYIDSESMHLDHLASRYLITGDTPLFRWEDAPVQKASQKKPWVQMNEQYLRRAHRGRSKCKRR